MTKAERAAYDKAHYAANRGKRRVQMAVWYAANSEKKRARNAAWDAANPEKRATVSRRAQLKRYGLTEAQWDAMFEAQGGVCASCGLPSEKQLHVDHDHDTGDVRGLLCGNCNRAEGLLRSSPRKARALAAYMEKHAP